MSKSVKSEARMLNLNGTSALPSQGLELTPERLTYGCTAIAEISTFKSRGKRATSTVARAGGASLK